MGVSCCQHRLRTGAARLEVDYARAMSLSGCRTRADAEASDRNDSLGGCRAEFELPPDVRYFDGNSLGALPKAVTPAVEAAVADQWGSWLVRSWKDPWIDLPARSAAKIARLIGARPKDVAVTDSVSVNLFKLLSAAVGLRPERNTILVDGDEFPTDLYVAQGLCDASGGAIRLQALDSGADWVSSLAGRDDVAVLCASHASYRTGALADMAAITMAAHAAGALVLWDLSHSAGAVDVDLGACNVDFAVGCGYKYLNGGPGAPAFLYVAPQWQEVVHNPIQGWLGHADFFAFERAYRPAPGVERFHCGTWPILSMTALCAALDAFEGVNLFALRGKSLALGDLLLERIEPLCEAYGIEVITPTEHHQRGSMIAVRHAEGYAVMQALIDRGIVGDFRPPDIMRFGLAPLYLRFVDVWDAIATLDEVLETRAWDTPAYRSRGRVT